MSKRVGFNLFKWTVYGLLVLNTYFFLRTEETLTAFLDSAAWLVLLGVMEYESSSLDSDYDSPWEKRAVIAANVFAYAVIVWAWIGYFREEDWVDAINATGWLGVCALLVYQMYAPGEYEGAEKTIVSTIKVALYAVLVGCAAWWTWDASNPLDAIDAWLWLVCFSVIEMNVFGFEQAAPAPVAIRADDPAPPDQPS